MKTRFCSCRHALALAGVLMHCGARAALEVVHTEAWVDGTVRVLFQDPQPPQPYTVERFDPDRPEAPWSPLPWYVLECAQPAVFAAYVPGMVQNPGFYRVSVAAGFGQPLVIATEPANGATGVPANLSRIRVIFDRPMAGTAALQADANWGASFVTWSADRRTAEIHRLSAATPLPAQASLNMVLNPDGTGFADPQGNALRPYRLRFQIAASDRPHVVSSYPEAGAVDVDPMIDTVTFTFSEPMMTTGGGFQSRNWPDWTMSWSADARTVSVRRGNAGTPLYNTSVMLAPFFIRTARGEFPAGFALTFTTAGPPTERIDADPAKGFNWPYYLMVPLQVTPPGTLLVETNNTGSDGDDPWFHEQSALSLLRWRSPFAVELGCPLLVPVFPRPRNPPAPEPGGLYIHALDRYSLSNQWAGIERIDLQLLAMIDDALQRLRAKGHAMDDKIFMMGFSASGAFTTRFSSLHPQRLKAVAPGSPGGWPIAPHSAWQGTPLPYPMGVRDHQALVGAPFNLAAFRQVRFFIYVGGADTNDAIDPRGWSDSEKTQVYALINYPGDPLLANRWPLAEQMYTAAGVNATFRVYPGVGHTITSEMFADLLAFFRASR